MQRTQQMQPTMQARAATENSPEDRPGIKGNEKGRFGASFPAVWKNAALIRRMLRQDAQLADKYIYYNVKLKKEAGRTWKLFRRKSWIGMFGTGML